MQAPFALLNRGGQRDRAGLRSLSRRKPRQDLPLLRRVRGPESAATGCFAIEVSVRRIANPRRSTPPQLPASTRSFYISFAKITLLFTPLAILPPAP